MTGVVTERTGKFCFNAMCRAHVVVFDCFIAGTFFGFICVKLQGHLDPRNVCTRSDVVVTTYMPPEWPESLLCSGKCSDAFAQRP